MGKVKIPEHLVKAEAFAGTLLAKPKAPTNADVTKMFRLIKEWPTQQRPNVAPGGYSNPVVEGMVLGLCPNRSGGCSVAQASQQCPQLTKVVTRWAAATLPDAKFRYGSIQVNYNYRARKHIDQNNLGPSFITSLGDHTGGELWTGDRGPYEGRDRYSFILFTPDKYNRLTSAVCKTAKDLGVTAATTDGADDAYFSNFRDLGDVDEDAHVAFTEQHHAENPPSFGSGALSVETNGYAAGRGWGWIAWQTDKLGKDKVHVEKFKKNATGIHVVELEVAPPAKPHHVVTFDLVEVHRFNLYQDTDRETARFAKWVDKLPANRVVGVCITDTAMAKTRPLSKQVYDTFRLLGAPDSLTLIGYREPFAFLGWKGAPKGAAALAQDAKKQSKELLRLDALKLLEKLDEAADRENTAPPKKKAKSAKRELQAGMNRIHASGETSIVRFDRPPCAVCAELDPLFEIMRTHFPGRVWRVDCAAAPGLCAPVDGDLRGPEIRAWTGEAFAAYGGERSAEALVAWAKLVLAPPPKTENFAAADFDPRGDDDAAATLALEPGRLQAWPGRPLPTRVFVPRTKAGKRPILVYLHGTPQPGDRFDDPGGGGGSSLLRAKGFVAKLATNATFAANFPFVAIVPCSGCHADGTYAPRPRGGPPAAGSYGWVPDNFARIDAIIAAAARHLGGDPARVLLTGQSYGGAAGPTAPLVAGLCCGDAACCPHVWAFHGANDVRADVANTDAWVEALRADPRRPPSQEVRYARYDPAPPLDGPWEGHGADGLAYDDDDFWAWLAARECPACAADGPFAGVG
ncbi:hydrolase [Aureococcus anophagefferens]|nr:hydrolase [Aureococcus anophagefferens]